MAPQIMSTPTANFGGNNGMIILADDLSGAQECIAAASRIPVGSIARTAPIATTILLGKEGTLPDAEILAIDTDSRCMPSEDATEQIHRALELLSTRKNFETGSPDQIFLKFDSILRGNIAAQLGKASEKIGPIVFCPAVPELNRVTRNGVVYVNQVPLANTGLWHMEPDFAPKSIEETLDGLETASISLEQVRSGALASILDGFPASIQVILCDAETAEDLDALALAITSTGLAAAGASGLCASLARALPPSSHLPQDGSSNICRDFPNVDPPGALFIVGTASKQAQKQVRVLKNHGIQKVSWSLGNTDDLPEGNCVITVKDPIRPEKSSQIDEAVAELVANNHRGRDLFLTGGQTARSVLDALGVTELHPIAQPEIGTVISCTADGRLIVTRPGSFGTTDNLLNSLRTIQQLRALSSSIERTSS